MPIPDFQTLMLPVLEAAANGEVTTSEVVGNLAERFGLTQEERLQKLPSGGQATFANRVYWARAYLRMAGLVDSRVRGRFAITEAGRQVLANKPKRIDLAFLRQFPDYLKWRTGAQKAGAGEAVETAAQVEEATARTPEEILRAAHSQIEQSLQEDLLKRVLGATPTFFESLIVDLLVKMGYGGSREDAGRAIGKSGDGGLDGVINEDMLGLDRIYLQAKRYAPEHKVGEHEIRDFAGSLESVKAAKGVFVTTSSFTESARTFPSKIVKRIVLIDGDELAQLMMKFDVGVRIDETLHLKKIDEDFFSPE